VEVGIPKRQISKICNRHLSILPRGLLAPGASHNGVQLPLNKMRKARLHLRIGVAEENVVGSDRSVWLAIVALSSVGHFAPRPPHLQQFVWRFCIILLFVHVKYDSEQELKFHYLTLAGK